jgi:hypothetical protein
MTLQSRVTLGPFRKDVSELNAERLHGRSLSVPGYPML